MFQPLEWFIGLRYLRSRRRRGVVSFMSAASLIGIALGVAALIVILSVMNGLESETRTRLLSMGPHATITAPGGMPDWRERAARLAAEDGIAAVSPYASLEAMLASGPNLRPAVVRGILPDEEQAASDVQRFLQGASLDELATGTQRIVLGRLLALNLGLSRGDAVTLLVPRVVDGRMAPRLAAFTVAGVFEAGVQEHDANLALVHLTDASDLKGLGGAPEGLAVRLVDPMKVATFERDYAAHLGTPLVYDDWSRQHRSLFTAMRIEKTMMTIILTFIVAVAAFNIVASLMMVVIDKQKDIAILRTYGLDPARVARIFLVQGAVIGLVGTLAGTALGLGLALNVEAIVPWLERTFRFQIMPGDVYYVTEIPSEVHWADVVVIPLIAFTVALVATIYPARRAAAVAPAHALRYD